MTVSMVFELRDTDPESSLTKLMRDVDKMPWADREYIIGQLMIFRGTQMIAAAAGAQAVDRHYAQKKERAAATRARREASSTLDNSPEGTP